MVDWIGADWLQSQNAATPSCGNHCFSLVLMSSNIYLCPALIVRFCLLPSLPMGMSKHLTFTARWKLFCIQWQRRKLIISLVWRCLQWARLPPRPAAAEAAWDVRKAAAAARLDENKIVLHQWERTDHVRRFEVGSKNKSFCFERVLYFEVGGKGTVSHFLSVWVCTQWLLTQWLSLKSGFEYLHGWVLLSQLKGPSKDRPKPVKPGNRMRRTISWCYCSARTLFCYILTPSCLNILTVL